MLLKFRVYIDGEFKRKSIRCVSGSDMKVLVGEILTTIVAYYPSAAWEYMKYVRTFRNLRDNYQLYALDATNYQPVEGDILLVEENGRAAYVNHVSEAVDRNGNSKFYVRERNRNCNGRVGINKIYQLQDGGIQPREAEAGQGMFNVLYRAEEGSQ